MLIGSGIMSTTLGMFLKTLSPSLNIVLVEQNEGIATESTDAWNNAGTGHAGYCELNYTPLKADGTVETVNAQAINEEFDISLQFWSYLVKNKIVSSQFLSATPHMSFVWGEDDIRFLAQRQKQLKDLSQFSDMVFSSDVDKLSSWMPLIMAGRDPEQKIAATKITHGLDVDFGLISRNVLNYLSEQSGFSVCTLTKVVGLKQSSDKTWQVSLNNTVTKEKSIINAKYVFIGAGGGSLPLLQKANVQAAKGYAGFPVSGQFLVCRNPSVVSQHKAKVYGSAPVDAPPMSVPHLDARRINGENILLFGPFAGFSTQFLKQGSSLDLIKSLRFNNIINIMQVGIKNLSLLTYLIKEVRQDHNARMNALREYYPQARDEDWELVHAGQRVQIIKPSEQGGVLQFGTELINNGDGTLSALLGASPGASTVASIAINVLEENFQDKMQSPEWQEKIRDMIPSYQQSLKDNPALLQKVRQYINKHLKIIY